MIFFDLQSSPVVHKSTLDDHDVTVLVLCSGTVIKETQPSNIGVVYLGLRLYSGSKNP